MKKEISFDSQFQMEFKDFLEGLDLSNWYRYYFIIKEVINLKPEKVLEVGAGNQVVKNCLKDFVKDYKTMDVNPRLEPDILSDLRKFRIEFKEKFDCLICADVLEHMPFEDLNNNFKNINSYLKNNGKAIITIPHRRARIMIISPLSYKKAKMIELPFWLKSNFKSFFKQVIKKDIWIDPHHCWEIGDGVVDRKDVESIIKKTGFKIEKFNKLLQVDFWLLKKIS
jgi:SAM-dependent methyltransferase